MLSAGAQTGFLHGVLDAGASGVRVVVRVRPGQKRPRPPRLVETGEEGWALEVTLAEAPVEGRANTALLRALATLFGVRNNQVSLVAGATGRLKRVAVAGDPAALQATLLAALAPAS